MFHMTLFVIINCKIVNEGGLKLFQLLRRRFPLFCERNINYSFRTALTCEDIRFSSLFAAGDVSRGGTFYERSLQALLSSAPRGFATRSHVLARLASLAQIGELARRLMHACSS